MTPSFELELWVCGSGIILFIQEAKVIVLKMVVEEGVWVAVCGVFF